jgi:Rieske 2Fe-2S family protein
MPLSATAGGAPVSASAGDVPVSASAGDVPVSASAGDVPLERSLPRASYVEEAEFGREREAMLFADWFCVGRAEAVAEPGQYLTAAVAGESIIVCRTRGRGLAGFYNLCRHRGSRLVPPAVCQPAADSGPTGTFDGSIRCPYHGWTYALDGTLRAAPFLADLRPHRSRLSLHRVEIGEWGGFVFVRLGPPPAEPQSAGDHVAEAGNRPAESAAGGGAPTLARWLGEIPARLAAYPLGELRTGRRMLYQVSANWKVILENFNECYHCGPVHPELCELVPAFRRGGGGDLDWDAGIPQRDGTYTFTRSGVSDRAPFPGLADEDLARHKGELVLPNLMLSLSADYVAAFTLWPQSAGHTVIACDLLFQAAELARPGFDPSDAVEFWDLVNRQDWAVCELVQDGMRSRAFTTGYLAPMEELSADVCRYVVSRLGPR